MKHLLKLLLAASQFGGHQNDDPLRFMEDSRRIHALQHQQAVMQHQQFMDQIAQQQFMDFSIQSVSPIDQGGFLPPMF